MVLYTSLGRDHNGGTFDCSGQYNMTCWLGISATECSLFACKIIHSDAPAVSSVLCENIILRVSIDCDIYHEFYPRRTTNGICILTQNICIMWIMVEKYPWTYTFEATHIQQIYAWKYNNNLRLELEMTHNSCLLIIMLLEVCYISPTNNPSKKAVCTLS